jgi:pyridoxine/pyridoxamine 5'-phosphate oxidase
MEPRATHARKEYEQSTLDETTVARDPIRQFAAWYDEAVAAGVPEPGFAAGSLVVGALPVACICSSKPMP